MLPEIFVSSLLKSLLCVCSEHTVYVLLSEPECGSYATSLDGDIQQVSMQCVVVTCCRGSTWLAAFILHTK